MGCAYLEKTGTALILTILAKVILKGQEISWAGHKCCISTQPYETHSKSFSSFYWGAGGWFWPSSSVGAPLGLPDPRPSDICSSEGILISLPDTVAPAGGKAAGDGH